jgi:hypothetical protein
MNVLTYLYYQLKRKFYPASANHRSPKPAPAEETVSSQIEQARAIADRYRALRADRDAAGTEMLEPVGLSLSELAEKAIAGEQVGEITLYDRPARLEVSSSGPQLVYRVADGLNLGFRVTKQEKLNASRLQDMLLTDLDKRLAAQEKNLAEMERSLAHMEAEIARPFEHATHLKQLRSRAAEIQAEIDKLNAGQPHAAPKIWPPCASGVT